MSVVGESDCLTAACYTVEAIGSKHRKKVITRDNMSKGRIEGIIQGAQGWRGGRWGERGGGGGG